MAVLSLEIRVDTPHMLEDIPNTSSLDQVDNRVWGRETSGTSQ